MATRYKKLPSELIGITDRLVSLDFDTGVWIRATINELVQQKKAQDEVADGAENPNKKPRARLKVSEATMLM